MLQRMLHVHRWKSDWAVRSQALAWLIRQRALAEPAAEAGDAVAAETSAEQAPAAAEGRAAAALSGSKRAADAPPQVRGGARASKGAVGLGLMGPTASQSRRGLG